MAALLSAMRKGSAPPEAGLNIQLLGSAVCQKALGFPNSERRSRGRANWPFFLSFAAMLLIALATLAAKGLPAPREAAVPSAAPGGDRLIALTFDDGPKPYVLMGTRSGKGIPSRSLLGLLDQQGVKATFFVMGWRLSKNADEMCRQVDGGVCREAAEEEHRRGHEIENHTYGHGDFRLMQKRYGEQWILDDIDRASRVIQPITSTRPAYLRPPDWDIWPELQEKIEARGYHVMTKSRTVPPALRDVDSEDYFCVGHNPAKCPKPSDYDFVLRSIQLRERQDVERHILVFHELPETVELLSRLIPGLKNRGYRFVLLREYMTAVKVKP